MVEYRWWGDFFGTGQAPDAATTGPLSPILRYEGGGAKTVRLEVVDVSGTTSAVTMVYAPS